MRLLVLILTLTILGFFASTNFVFASDDDDDELEAEVEENNTGLILATDANFSNRTDNFSPGQTIWVKIQKDAGDSQKRQLNLRDNNYNLLESFTFEVSGNEFKKSITAPTSSGYFSLEAKIESPGSVSTSVKTIKVGSVQNSSLNIKVDNESPGQTLGKSKSPSPKASPIATPSPTASPTEQPSPSPEPSPITNGQNIFDQMREFFASIFKIFEFFSL